MNIIVTQDHIDIGVRETSWKCPIAIALIEKTGDSWNVYDETTTNEDTYTQYKLSKTARQFVVDFDKGLPVSPQKFRLTKIARE